MRVESQHLIEHALDELRRAEANLPPEPRHDEHTIGGYFYNQWTPDYARWVKMRGAIAHARRDLEEALGEQNAASA